MAGPDAIGPEDVLQIVITSSETAAEQLKGEYKKRWEQGNESLYIDVVNNETADVQVYLYSQNQYVLKLPVETKYK